MAVLKLSQIAAASGNPASTDSFVGVTAANADVRFSGAQILSSVFGAVSGDATATSGGVLTLASTIAAAGPVGDASHVAQVTFDAKGRLMTVTSVSIAIAAGAVSGLAPSATTDTTNASNISSGILAAAVGGTGVNNGTKTLTFSNSLTFAGTDGTAFTFPAVSDIVACLGTAQTFSAANVFSANGATTVPAVKLNGTWFTGTSPRPQFLIEPSGATAAAWNANGVGLGINSASGFNGNLVHLFANASELLRVTSAGNIQQITGAFSTNASIQIGTTLFLTGATPLTSPASAVVQFGAANAAAPVAQTVRSQGSRSGTDSNVSGGNLTIQSGGGTGNSTGSQLILQSPLPVASGTGAQTQTTGLTLQNGSLIAGPSGAAATTATDGFLYLPTCAGPPTGVPTTQTGKVALIYDTTDDQLYIYDGAWKQPKTPAAAAIVNWQ